MNWKKEGYKVDDNACLVLKVMGEVSKVIDAKVTYVGTKKLKVESENRCFEFIDSNYKSGAIFGYAYYIYKSKEEYDAIVSEENAIESLKNEIIEKVPELELSDLLAIKKLIDKI